MMLSVSDVYGAICDFHVVTYAATWEGLVEPPPNWNAKFLVNSSGEGIRRGGGGKVWDEIGEARGERCSVGHDSLTS